MGSESSVISFLGTHRKGVCMGLLVRRGWTVYVKLSNVGVRHGLGGMETDEELEFDPVPSHLRR